jgi:hypothetical protein
LAAHRRNQGRTTTAKTALNTGMKTGWKIRRFSRRRVRKNNQRITILDPPPPGTGASTAGTASTTSPTKSSLLGIKALKKKIFCHCHFHNNILTSRNKMPRSVYNYNYKRLFHRITNRGGHQPTSAAPDAQQHSRIYRATTTTPTIV